MVSKEADTYIFSFSIQELLQGTANGFGAQLIHHTVLITKLIPD